jgi:hypothetical protein
MSPIGNLTAYNFSTKSIEMCIVIPNVYIPKITKSILLEFK